MRDYQQGKQNTGVVILQICMLSNGMFYISMWDYFALINY